MLAWLQIRARRMRQVKLGEWSQSPVLLLIFGPIYAIVLGWLENDLSAWWFDGQGANSLRIVVALVVLSVLSVWLWKVGDDWIPVRGLRSCTIDHTRVRLLCVLVSASPFSFTLKGRQLLITPKEGESKTLQLSGDLDQDRALLEGYRMLQHLLNMLRPYLLAGNRTLQVLPVLSKTTAPHFDSLRDFLACYGVQLIKPARPPFPDGYAQQQIYEHINSLLSQCAQQNLKADEVVFDTSGGTSSMSVAATLATLHHGIACQIVDTNHPDEVVNYRVHLQRKPASFE